MVVRSASEPQKEAFPMMWLMKDNPNFVGHVGFYVSAMIMRPSGEDS